MSGCGGGSSSGEPLSDSEFVAQANADCANVYRQYANADLAQRAGVLTGGVAKLKELLHRLSSKTHSSDSSKRSKQRPAHGRK